MSKKDLFGIIYVSIWVIIWGSIGSIIDFPLLENNIYVAGSLGQITTFVAAGLISSITAILIFPTLTKKFNLK